MAHQCSTSTLLPQQYPCTCPASWSALGAVADSTDTRPPSTHCCHFLLRYRYMVSGANTATSIPDVRSTQPICPAVAVPCIRPRTAVARWVIGLESTIASSHEGMVRGSTKMLLAKVRGKSAIMLTPITELGVLKTSPSAVQIHDRLNENTRRSATESSTPTTPPSGRKPSTRPSTITIVDAIV